MTPVFAARRRAEEFAALVETPSTGGSGDPRYDDLLRLVGSLRDTAPVTARPEFVADLRERLLTETSTKDNSAGQIRVANLLNELEKGQLEEVMLDLEASGSDVKAIRSKLFTFDDVPMLTQKARVTLFDGISTETVTLALRRADPSMLEAVLSAIGFGGLLLATYTEGKQNNHPETVASARKLARMLLEMVLKADPEKMQIEGGKIVLK